MNKLTIAAASIILALGSASAFAEDTVTTIGNDVGLITFDGAVSDTTCTITTNNGINANNVTIREGANKRGNSSRLTQSFHFFMFEPIFSPVNALNQPI